MQPIMPNDGSRRSGVHDEVSATACRVGEKHGFFLLGPTAPVGEICLRVALDAPPETDVAVGLEPVGISIVLPGPSPVCRPRAARDRAAYRRWGGEHDRYADWHDVPATSLLLVEGAGAGAGPNADFESVLIWLEADRDVRFRRGIERDAQAYLLHWRRWAEQEEAVFLADATRSRADLIVDTTTP